MPIIDLLFNITKRENILEKYYNECLKTNISKIEDSASADCDIQYSNPA